MAQRISQIASGYADGHDANPLQHAPLLPISVARPPLEPAPDLANAPTVSRLEHRVDCQELYRRVPPLVDHYITGDPEPLAAVGRALDTPRPRPRASRHWPALIITTGALAIAPGSFATAPHTPS